jgi:signal transduction histidine kinase
VTLDGEDYFISHSALAAAGGSIAVAAPVDEVTEQATPIAAGIRDEGTRTLQIMLAALAGLFVAGLAGATYLNRQVLVGPLRNLTAATRQVAGGDLSANVASGRKDELGELAADFNVMVEQLRESERLLEQRVDDRTRELSTLLEVARNVGSTLELQPLLQLILEQVRALAPYDRSLVMIREGDELRVLAMRSEAGFEMEPAQMQLRAPIADGGLIWELIERGEPAIIEDTRANSPLAEAWRYNNKLVLELALQRVGSWMSVPIRLGDRTIGMLVTSKEERGFFTQRHAELVTAIGTHAGMAINNAQLFEQTQRQARDLEALARADAELFRSLDLDHVLQSMVDVAVDILRADKGIVMLHHGDVDVIRAHRNYAPEHVVAFNRTLAGIPHDEPDPADQLPQVYSSLDEAPEFIAVGLAQEGIVSHMSVPIRNPEQMLGVFGVSFVRAHTFTEDEKRLYAALADRAAVAIQNADLYAKAQQAASLEERQRLARELHDSVSQALYGIALGTRTARMRLGEDTHNAAEPLDYVGSLAQAGLAEMRALIFELRPESLEEEGLVAAIEKQAASVAARYKIEVALDLCEEPSSCSLDAKEALYRITQEALHNIVKHAHARRVDVGLRRTDAAIELTVRDDGRGFDTGQSFPGHVGLQSMPERAARLGGAVMIESAPGQGTKVTATLPLVAV